MAIIKTAAQVRAEMPSNTAFDSACERVMAHIERAKSVGESHALFSPGDYTIYEDVKEAFSKAGYTFRSVGMVAGVMQKDLYICW